MPGYFSLFLFMSGSASICQISRVWVRLFQVRQIYVTLVQVVSYMSEVRFVQVVR
jgi:hypothetical protein